MKQHLLVSVMIFLFLSGFQAIPAKDVRVLLKDIKPTHVETEEMYVPLELVKEINEEIDDENFFAKPADIEPTDTGSFFVYDFLLLKIFLFDKDFKLVKIFLKKGQGPSEVQRQAGGYDKMYFTKNGFLNLAAPYNKKLIVFDKDGLFVKDRPAPYDNLCMFSPVTDALDNLYLVSKRSSGINVFDKTGKLQYTLLNSEDYKYFINHVREIDKRYLEFGAGLESTIDNTQYDFVSGNRLLIYVANASTVYLFNGRKLEKKFHVWPKKALERHYAYIQKLEKKLNSKNFETNLFNFLFVDKDDETHFYFDGLIQERGNKKVGVAYKFDLNGKLKNIYYADRPVRLLAKRNHLFYGLHKGNVYIFKIKNQEKQK